MWLCSWHRNSPGSFAFIFEARKSGGGKIKVYTIFSPCEISEFWCDPRCRWIFTGIKEFTRVPLVLRAWRNLFFSTLGAPFLTFEFFTRNYMLRVATIIVTLLFLRGWFTDLNFYCAVLNDTLQKKRGGKFARDNIILDKNYSYHLIIA